MKIKLYTNWPIMKYWVNKTFMVMRMTIIIMLLSVTQLLAVESYSQNTRISLNVDNQSVKEVLDKIQNQSDFFFMFNSKIVDVERKVNIKAGNEKISFVLGKLFAGTDIAYTVIDKQIVLFSTHSIQQQQQKKKLTGRVTDDKGIPLPGASVVIQGSTEGVITTVDGTFTINVPENAKTLSVSFIGMKKQNVDIGDRVSFEIVLEPLIVGLNDVVVIGYGTQKKANLTGAVGGIDPNVIKNRPVSNIGLALQGEIPGLTVSISSGRSTATPTLNIRGFTSLNGGSPLIIIDGIPSDADAFARLSVNDVESISTLMDAASAAIYGARAAYGVILVTTKKGEGTGIKVTYNAHFDFRRPNNIPKFMTDQDTALMLRVQGTGTWYSLADIYGSNDLDYLHKVTKGLAPMVRLNPDNNKYWQYAGRTNWFEEACNNYGISQRHDVAVSGTSGKASYYFSAGYYDQDGIFKYGNDVLGRYSLRGKVDIQAADWLTFSNNTSYSLDNYNQPSQGINMNSLFSTSTLDVPKNPDGTWTSSGASVLGSLQEGGRSISNTGAFNTIFTMKGEFFKKLLTVTGRASFSRTSYDYRTYSVPIYYETGPNLPLGVLNPTTSAEHDASSTNQNVYDVFADVDKSFNKHHFHYLLGYNQDYWYSDSFSAYRQNLISTSVPSIQLGTGVPTVGEDIKDYATRSVFTRFSYDYDQKYLFEMNGRDDGTSRFPKNDRYGFFPSVSLGWNIAREKFFTPFTQYLNVLKPRFSYGNLGNQDVGYYSYLSTMGNGKTSSLLNGPTYDQQLSIYAPGLVSGSLTWEKVRTTNYGLDLAALNNRLSATFEYYQRATTDILTKSKTLPSVLGTTEPQANAAASITKGWELTLTWHDKFKLSNSDFKYNVRFAISDSRAWITSYDNPDGKLSDYFKGYEIGTIYGFVSKGLFQTPAELANHANQSSFWSYPGYTVPGPGDIKFEDLNGDGVIKAGTTIKDMEDTKIIGNSRIRYPASVRVDLEWKGFDLSAFFQGVLKRDYYPTDNYFWNIYQSPWTNIQQYVFDNMWTPTNTGAYMPKIKGYAASYWSGAEMLQYNTRYLQNASYVRLKNLTMGYTLPNSLTKRLKIQTVRVYFSGENLLTWTGIKNPNLDPETLGADYPMQRTYVVGLNINF
ncbi:MAG: TonB-dependent receptor [Bacteroidetes bacterium]|nr:TonB-dependent receptor [Bacteroidota bacterium]